MLLHHVYFPIDYILPFYLRILVPNLSVGNTNCNEGEKLQIKDCCTESSPCDEGQGDCDNDKECKGNLVCGKNNCDNLKFPWRGTDCCEIGE